MASPEHCAENNTQIPSASKLATIDPCKGRTHQGKVSWTRELMRKVAESISLTFVCKSIKHLTQRWDESNPGDDMSLTCWWMTVRFCESTKI
jgi:hypothetical protein